MCIRDRATEQYTVQVYSIINSQGWNWKYSAVHKQEIDLHMGHMSTFWSGYLASCQSHSVLRTINISNANQIKLIINKTKLQWNRSVNILKIETKWKYYKYL